MPFWPNKPRSCTTAARPKPFTASWVWPLIDSPHQGRVPRTARQLPRLEHRQRRTALQPAQRRPRLRPRGQPDLGDRPGAARQRDDHADAVPGRDSVICSHNRLHPADKNASQVAIQPDHRHAGQQVFVTPYADVDLAGLAQFGNNTTWANPSPMGKSWLAGSCIAIRRPRRSRPGPSSCRRSSGRPTGAPTSRSWRIWAR